MHTIIINYEFESAILSVTLVVAEWSHTDQNKIKIDTYKPPPHAILL